MLVRIAFLVKCIYAKREGVASGDQHTDFDLSVMHGDAYRIFMAKRNTTPLWIVSRRLWLLLHNMSRKLQAD